MSLSQEIRLRYPSAVSLPPRDELHWEYFVRVGNRWWSTFLGAWHGSGYTQTVKRVNLWLLYNIQVPWIVSYIKVAVAGEERCDEAGCIPYDVCFHSSHKYDHHDVSVSNTDFAFIEPWGIGSWHTVRFNNDSTGNTYVIDAEYCDRWRWNGSGLA
jgi:hypothetical protein